MPLSTFLDKCSTTGLMYSTWFLFHGSLKEKTKLKKKKKKVTLPKYSQTSRTNQPIWTMRLGWQENTLQRFW